MIIPGNHRTYKVGMFRVRNRVCSVWNYGIYPGNGDVINDSGNPDPKITLWRMLFLTHNSVQGWALTIKTTVTRGHKDPRIVNFRLSITRAGTPGAMWKGVICSHVVSGANIDCTDAGLTDPDQPLLFSLSSQSHD